MVAVAVTETCGICGETVPFSATLHLPVHTRGAGVIDRYVYRACYHAEVVPLLE